MNQDSLNNAKQHQKIVQSRIQNEDIVFLYNLGGNLTVFIFTLCMFGCVRRKRKDDDRFDEKKRLLMDEHKEHDQAL